MSENNAANSKRASFFMFTPISFWQSVWFFIAASIFSRLIANQLGLPNHDLFDGNANLVHVAVRFALIAALYVLFRLTASWLLSNVSFLQTRKKKA
jgi:hypothetical protein